MDDLIGRYVTLEGVFRAPDEYTLVKGGLTISLLKGINYLGVLEHSKMIAKFNKRCSS